MSSLAVVMVAVADQLRTELAPLLDGVQVEPLQVTNPTAPCLDIYPADPFLTETAFHNPAAASYEAVFTVRARVSPIDLDAGQELLLELLDPRGELGVLTALAADETFGGAVDASSAALAVAWDQSSGGGTLIGAEWRLTVELS